MYSWYIRILHIDLEYFYEYTYHKTLFIVSGIIVKIEKKSSNFVSIKCMCKRGTKPENLFFTFDLIHWTKNGVPYNIKLT